MLQFGAGLCLPAAVLILVFVYSLTQANSLADARPCSTPTQDANSTCLSVLPGHILNQWSGRISTNVDLSVGGVDVSTGYYCGLSPDGACAGMTFAPGSDVTTGWWKGRIVLLGPSDATPRVLTTSNPHTDLPIEGALIVLLLLPAASFLFAGSFLWVRGRFSNRMVQE